MTRSALPYIAPCDSPQLAQDRICMQAMFECSKMRISIQHKVCEDFTTATRRNPTIAVESDNRPRLRETDRNTVACPSLA